MNFHRCLEMYIRDNCFARHMINTFKSRTYWDYIIPALLWCFLTRYTLLFVIKPILFLLKKTNGQIFWVKKISESSSKAENKEIVAIEYNVKRYKCLPFFLIYKSFIECLISIEDNFIMITNHMWNFIKYKITANYRWLKSKVPMFE